MALVLMNNDFVIYLGQKQEPPRKHNQGPFHLLFFSIKYSIFTIHMIGKFCYKQEKKNFFSDFMNRLFCVFNSKFHDLNRKFYFFEI